MSESHERQALLAGENIGRVLTDYSEQFHQGFMKLLSRRFNTRRVHSNIVYQEYIADKVQFNYYYSQYMAS
jgi:DNA/RNA-binding protein KIN17